MAFLVSGLPTPAQANVSTTVVVDGSLADWAPVFADGSNTNFDPVAAADTPVPGTADRDLSMNAYTWDSTFLYVYFRRTTTGNNQIEFYAYVDTNGDNKLSSATDRVIDMSFNGSSPKGVAVYRYNDGGAPYTMGPNGSFPPGPLGTQVTLSGQPAMQEAAGGDGLEFEGRVPWSYLGVPAGSPITIKYGCGQNQNLPGGLQDITGSQSGRYRGITLASSSSQAVQASSTVGYTHSITNSGNDADTIDLTAASSAGFASTIKAFPGGTTISSITLAAGQTATFTVDVAIPSGISDGTQDQLVVTATSRGDPAVFDQNTDTTLIGLVLVIPGKTESIAPGLTCVFANVITNASTTTRTVNLSSASAHDWATSVYDASGSTLISSAILAPNTSLSVAVKVSVPATASIGMSDATNLYAVDSTDSTARGQGVDTALIRGELAVTPTNAGSAGPNTYAWYKHTVTNSGTTTRTITLTSTGTRGWPAVVLDSTRLNPIASVTLAPFGGAKDVWLRVMVPVGTPDNTVQTENVVASAGALSASGTDVTTCSRLGTFGSSSFSDSKASFVLGKTVYVRATGLPSGSNVTFKWYNSTGALAFTSISMAVDTQGMTWSSYVPPLTGPAGQWAVAVFNGGGTEITRTNFVMTYDAKLGGLSATDATSIGDTSSVTATLTNSGGLAITGSRVDYNVWWDQNGDNVFDSGDTWYDASGVAHAWTGAVTDRAHATNVGVFPAGSTWSDPGWGITNANFANAGAYRVTAKWYAADGTLIDSANTTFKSSYYQLSLTLSSNDVRFGNVDPGVPVAAAPITVTVSSNLIYDLSKSTSGSVAAMGLTTSLGAKTGETQGTRGYSDLYSVNAPWTTDPGVLLQATVVYTVVAR